ncbi:hypothetical protein PIB30_025124 [Stylosanthes scabra]|uniref:Cytochrome P450 n=1 Tax=Stylosanthes scabra TaxID=79078 RepID=A0ABU6WCZ9_9FABA|nr:hypothetical protein [Stylosanthes scabra]
MDYYLTLILLILSFLVSTLLFSFIIIQKQHSKLLPPGPKPYPIIGNLLHLLLNNKNNYNSLQTFINLSKTYGPIITLKLGTLTSIVISSPQIAKEALQKNDVALSNRTIPYTIFSTLEEHCKKSIIFLPSSTKWRSFRRACATRIFSPQRLDSMQILRKRKAQDLLDFLHECCKKGEALDIGEAIFKTVLNTISNTFISMDLVDYYDNEKFKVFKDIVFGFTEESTRPCLGDFFPLLGFLDSRAARARTKDRYAKLYAVIDGAMEERIRLRDSKPGCYSQEFNDALDSLLDLVDEESSEFNRHDVVPLLMDLFVASIDTTSSTLEWAMAELMHNPTKLHKVREELHQLLGQNEEVEESHITKLPYINAIVKETLRLHPPTPLLVPHKANGDVELGGFTVPKNAQILINVWSIGRDSHIWANPNSFEPERFLDSEIDFKGKNFELIPFGSGRRICPGLPLASRSLSFMLASLLYHFNWKIANEMKPEDINMSFSFGITLHKAQPLLLVPIKI